MWMPTHVQVTVQKADGLLLKGKNSTNDCFVTIALGKIKYQTSVKEKSGPQVDWHEECELPIPDQGNTAEIILTALHHNFLGVDEFLGRVAIPLNSLDIYERPKNKWYPLKSKPGKEGKNKERGKLEVKIQFTVRAGSLTNLSKKEKHKSSIGHVAQSVGGSLMSLGSAERRKGIKKFAKSIGSKMNLKGKKKGGHSEDDASSIGSVGSLKIRSNNLGKFRSRQTLEDADPGVVSEDEDEFTFDDLSHKSSASSLSQSANNRTVSPVVKTSENPSPTENIKRNNLTGGIAPVKPPRSDQKPQDEWESKLLGNKSKSTLRPGSSESLNRRSWDSSKLASQIEEEPSEFLDVPISKQDTLSLKANLPPASPKKEEKEGMFSKFKHFRKEKTEFTPEHDKPLGNSTERIIIGGENESRAPIQNNRISNELLQKFEGKTREDLILALCETQNDLEKQKKKLKDLEDYLDDLLLRVMETTPRILQNPYVTCKMSHKSLKG
ncbi:rab11 family-interacting protein 2 isoform X2 [Anoplophora glabripennis]|uniref:rab11 family-interacting protein 2 isoform X2 n=1 Tax=Anoplophora glabripennis TaxID=217634 RepID=UPI000874BE12|nr:rab11 family-interacting protein 2 isoform X2 [Anoplophora glabripennis]